MGCPVLNPDLPQYILPLSLPSFIPPSLFLSVLKGTLANLIIDLPDAAVLRRGWNNLPESVDGLAQSQQCISREVKVGLKSLQYTPSKAWVCIVQFCLNSCKLDNSP